MTLEDAIEIIDGLEHAGVAVWVDGGWCVDALVGHQLRAHDDLDIAIDHADEPALRDHLAARGYVLIPSVDESAWNYLLADAPGRQIDLHVFEFDAEGNNIYGVAYPRDSLTGHATLGDLEVRCIAPDWMFSFKTGYPPRQRDLLDIEALANRFGYDIPESHRPNVLCREISAFGPKTAQKPEISRQ